MGLRFLTTLQTPQIRSGPWLSATRHPPLSAYRYLVTDPIHIFSVLPFVPRVPFQFTLFHQVHQSSLTLAIFCVHSFLLLFLIVTPLHNTSTVFCYKNIYVKMLPTSIFISLAGLIHLSTAGYVLQDDYSVDKFFSMFDFFTVSIHRRQIRTSFSIIQ